MTTKTETPIKSTTEKIVIVGQESFRVPIDAAEKDLRDHLAAMFPDVANATVQKGTRTIENVIYDTIEFVKRAGTKGAADLIPLLAQIPALRLSPPRTAIATLLNRVSAGNCTIAEALDADLRCVITNLPESSLRVSGVTLCAQLDSLSPVAGDDVSAW
jgi:hypothetical protein